MKTIKTFLLLSILILTQLSSFSQEGYPKKIVIDGDTLCAITIDQVRKLNFVYIKDDFLKEMNDTLVVQNERYKSLSNKYSDLVKEYEVTMNLRKQVISEQDTIISNYKKENKRSKVRLIFWKTTCVLVATVETAAVIYYRFFYRYSHA